MSEPPQQSQMMMKGSGVSNEKAATTRRRTDSMAEAMSETSASSWYDDAPITDEQIKSVRHSLLMPIAERGAAFAPFVVRKLLAEIDRLNTVLDANRVVRNAAESSSRTYKAVVDRLKAERTELRAEVERLRAGQPELTDEYGMRITYVSTHTAEGAIADTLADALEALAAFDAKQRDDVLSRELIRREVGPWGGFEKGDDRG